MTPRGDYAYCLSLWGRGMSGTSTRCCGKKIELSTANFSERLDIGVWGCGRMRVTHGYLASESEVNAR